MATVVKDLSVVLPAHNEASVIATTVRQAVTKLRPFVPTVEVIVVDDGSVDATHAVLERLSNEIPELRVVRHRVNRGYGAALRSGFLAARHHWVFFMDSDGQFSIDDLTTFLPHASSHVIVVGYRQDRQDLGHRKMNAWLWNTLIRLLFGLRVRDLDCAYKLFPRRLLRDISLYAQGAFINAELLILAKRKGYGLVELPVHHRQRLSGAATGARPRVILRAFRELISFYRRQL